jgi:hypothetical protein
VDLGVGEVSKFYGSMEIVGRKGMITVSKLTKRISFICLFDVHFAFPVFIGNAVCDLLKREVRGLR